MNCLRCGTKTSVVKTLQFDSDEPTKRLRRCPCGFQRTSIEKWLPATTGNHRQPPATAPQPPPTTANSPATPNVRASDPEVCVLNSDLPLEDQNQTLTRVGTEYPAAFEGEWNRTSKTGSKFAALKAWKVLGKPAFGAAWSEWSKLDGWRRGFVPHVATWLNDRRFEQEPAEVAKAAADARCAFHRAPGTLGKRPPAGWFASCPECKHAQAAQGGRSGPVVAIDELAAETARRLAAQKPPRPWSDAEKAEAERLRKGTA